MMMGAPIRAVTLLTGMAPSKPGARAIKLQISANNAPHKAVAGISIDISDLTLARELWDRIPQEKLQDFATVVINHCTHYCAPLLPNGNLTILLITDTGTIYNNQSKT